MSQVRDNVGVNGGNVPNLPTDNDTQAANSAHDSAALGPTEEQINLRHERREKDFRSAKQDMQADFLKKIGDPPGYGANEDGDAKQLKTSMAENGLPVPTGQQVQTAYNAIGQTKEFQSAVQTVKGALDGEAPVPSPKEMVTMLSKVGAADTTGHLAINLPASTEQPAAAGKNGAGAPKIMIATPGEQAPLVAQNAAANTPASGADSHEGLNGLVATNNIAALVMLVTLAAQKETTKEKNDVLRKIKMFNGMLEGVNKLVNSQLIPAQKQLSDMREAGKDKKDFKPENAQVPINYPSSIDTDHASVNEAGDIVLNCAWNDGKGGPSRRLVNSQDLGVLINQADQTRTSIQNNQTQQSNRFQSKDNQMSAAWNILNAVLKNTHDGVTSTVKNI